MQWSTHYSNLKLHKNSRGRYIISFYIDGRRYRFSHGKCLGCTIKPNTLYGEAKHQASLELLGRFKKALDEGWSPNSPTGSNPPFEQLDLCRFLLVLKPRPMKRFVAFLSLAALCLLSTEALSQTTFTGAISQDWGEEGNWTHGLPAPGNDATIPEGLLVRNYGTIHNDFDGIINNYGTIVNEPDGTINNYGTIVNIPTQDWVGMYWGGGCYQLRHHQSMRHMDWGFSRGVPLFK